MHLTLKLATIMCMGGPLTTVKKGDYYCGETKGRGGVALDPGTKKRIQMKFKDQGFKRRDSGSK